MNTKHPKRGRNAAAQGKRTENVVSATLMPYVDVIDWRDYKKQYGLTDQDSLKVKPSSPVAIRQFPVAHPYRPEARHGKQDVVLFANGHRIYIQIKSQTSSGSCDEKLSFAFSIARQNAEFADGFILILLGPRWDKLSGLRAAMKQECEQLRRYDVWSHVVIGEMELADCWKRMKIAGLL